MLNAWDKARTNGPETEKKFQQEFVDSELYEQIKELEKPIEIKQDNCTEILLQSNHKK